jgi:phosphoribosylformimino-5-aminoimidazole carboxamide ribotide isomerase
MQIIPVIDVRGGRAERAIGGRRAEYRPVELPWVPGSGPIELARAIRGKYPIGSIYVADLDGIEGREAGAGWLAELCETGPTWVDRGLKDGADARRFAWPDGARPVAGLETLEGPGALTEIVGAIGGDRVVFSLDLCDGRPLAGWPGNAIGAARAAIEAGVHHVLLLDVARVGEGGGLAAWAVPMLRSLRDARLDAAWYAGGGLRDAGELEGLRRAGFAGVLVGSALLDGRLDGVFDGG